MALDPREGLVEFRDFKGLRNTVDERNFDNGDLSVALNCDIDDGLNITRRKGFSTVVVAGVDRALFAAGSTCLGVGSNALKQILPNYGTTTLRSGLTALRDLSYAAVADRVYYTNGIENGVVENGASRTWGLTVPGLPTASATGGSLRAGRYQFVVTYLREDGQESGASRAGVFELTSTGGVALSAIPVSTDPTVTHKAVYATAVDGGGFYRAGIITNAETVFSILELRTDAAPLETQFLAPPPAGDFIGYWGGIMLVAQGSRLYPSEPYAPELFDLRKAVPFTDRVVMVAPAKDGVWLGTDSEIIWLAGDSPEKWTYTQRADYGVIPGTFAYAPGEHLGDGSGTGDEMVYFASKRGHCVGHANGTLVNLTESRFAYPAQEKGAGIVRRHRGTIQFLTTLQGSETAANSVS